MHIKRNNKILNKKEIDKLSLPLEKDKVIQHKKNAIKKLNNLFEYYINEPSGRYLKKANLLSYWFETYVDYIKKEDAYDPKKQIRYNRGDVVKVNFGFNVGKEYGGLHYAIVLDKNNHHSANVVTVVPLTSGTADETYPTDVFLGSELFSKLDTRHAYMLKQAQKDLDECNRLKSSIDSANSAIEKIANKIESQDNVENEIAATLVDNINVLISNQNELNSKVAQTEGDILFLQKSRQEISKLKSGSIALISQITTIDKARIYTPRKSTDVLYGINFSDEKMNAINEAIKAKLIF